MTVDEILYQLRTALSELFPEATPDQIEVALAELLLYVRHNWS